MFNPEPWNLDEFTNECKKEWKSDIRPKWVYNFYGGRNFLQQTKDFSNIVYVNGIMDPWYSGCPKVSSNDKVIVIEADSAHHLDLRYPNEKDPESIIEARKLVEVMIKDWMDN